MKKLQQIVAAAALVVAGSANAAIDRGDNANGSLFMIAFDNLGGSTTAGMFDLGYQINDVLTAAGVASTGRESLGALAQPGTTVVWDFVNNTVTLNGVAVTTLGTNDWTAAYNRLLANADPVSDIRYVVGAFDWSGGDGLLKSGEGLRYLATGGVTQTATVLASQNANSSTNMSQPASNANDIFTPLANKGTIGSADNGAYTFIAADGATNRASGYVMAGDGFASSWRTQNKLANNTVKADVTTGLWVLDGSGVEQLLGTVNFSTNTGTLIYTAVPEASTYATMLLGLGMMGGLMAARRRRA